MITKTQTAIYNRLSKQLIWNKAPNYGSYSYDSDNNVFYGLNSYDIVKFKLNTDASANIISAINLSTKFVYNANISCELIPNTNCFYLLTENIMNIYDFGENKLFSIPTSNLRSTGLNNDLYSYKMFYKGNYFYILSRNHNDGYIICCYDISNFKFVKSFTVPSWEQYIVDDNYLYYFDTYVFNSKQYFISRVKLFE
jgi:hypothetical protein